MQKLLLLGLITLDTFLLPFFPSQAQNLQNNSEISECRAALQTAQERIKKGRNIKITAMTKQDISSIYNDHPEHRSFGYVFGLNGPASQSVMNSGQFMASISKSIMQHCPDVSIVEFSLHRTDAVVTFGYSGKNKVSLFNDCISLDEARSGVKLSWGKITCL